jgi:glutamate 5-kinase
MIVVCKVGTSTLCAGGDALSKPRMLSLVQQVVAARSAGHRVVLVSSGAVAAGRAVLGPREYGRGLPVKQMLSAVGQASLMRQWADLFGLFGIPVGQVLLTRAELASRLGFLNARDTVQTLLEHGVVPVVNENDTLATDEIRVGDNDTLSALVANLLGADLLVLLTDMPGLFTSDPRMDPGASLIPEVSAADESLDGFAKDASSGVGTGGMRTKVTAARLAGSGGTTTVVASGSEIDVLNRIVAGEPLGTRFLPSSTRPESRKRWILSEPRVGSIEVDPGAASRLTSGGASLLPVGIRGVDGEFDRGAVVLVRCGGDAVGVGICAYDSAEIGRIAGARSDQIAALLGYDTGDVVIHRDDLVLL